MLRFTLLSYGNLSFLENVIDPNKFEITFWYCLINSVVVKISSKNSESKLSHYPKYLGTFFLRFEEELEIEEKLSRPEK